jgi:hypothetical protein
MKDPVAQIKAWLFPSIITVLAGIIWNDVQEIKSDVKSLMAQSNIDKTRIDNLERLVYKVSPTSNVPDRNKETKYVAIVAIMPNNKDIEDSVQIKKKML